MSPVYVRLLVEGNLDEAVGRRIASHCGLSVAAVHGRQGAGYVRQRILPFNASAAGMPVIAIADAMDMQEECPPATIAKLLPRPHPNMRFRLAVPEVEAWLLADRESIAAFLSVPLARIPENPEAVADPKACLISIARRSRRPALARLMVPPPGAAGVEGPAYTSEMQRFVDDHWDIAASAVRSPSLNGCIEAARTLAHA